MGNGEMDASDCLSYYILTKLFHLVCNLQNDLSLQVYIYLHIHVAQNTVISYVDRF